MANPNTNNETPRMATIVDTWKYMMISAMPPEYAVLTKATASVATAWSMVMVHFLDFENCCGLLPSWGRKSTT